MGRVGVLAVLIVALAGCSSAGEGGAGTTGAPATSTTAVPTTSTSTVPPGPTEPELQAELVQMFQDDQKERGVIDPEDEGEPLTTSDGARSSRLKEIITQYGWPTISMVGADGATAAWVIAQHSDLDQAFQAEALELMAAAVAAGEADPTELAYLTDRVAVGKGEPQTYGTQVGCEGLEVVPAVGLVDPDNVDELRAAAGMDPLAVYYAEFGDMCGG